MRFGDKLKLIFEALDLSYSNISKVTGISQVQLFDIVNNRISPTVEVLDVLSYLVGQDLYGLYTKSLSDRDVFNFIENIDEKNVNLDFDMEYELKVMKKKIEQMEEDQENQAKLDYTKKEYHRLYAKNQMYNHHSYTKAIDYIVYYINYTYGINIMEDEIQKIHPVDGRIVLLLVESLLAIGQKKLGLEILKKLSNCRSLSDLMEIKCTNLIAENYVALAMYKESFQFAELGIELSIKYNINALMPDLLLWKAVSEIAIGMTSARSTIESLIRYTRILRNDANLERFVRIFKDKFGIDIMRPGGFHPGEKIRI